MTFPWRFILQSFALNFVTFLVKLTLNLNGHPTEQGGALTCVTAPSDAPSLSAEPAYSAASGSVAIGLLGVRSRSAVLQIILAKCPADLAALCRARMALGGVAQ